MGDVAAAADVEQPVVTVLKRVFDLQIRDRMHRVRARNVFTAAGRVSMPNHAPSGPRSAPNFTDSRTLSRRPRMARPTSSSLCPMP